MRFFKFIDLHFYRSCRAGRGSGADVLPAGSGDEPSPATAFKRAILALVEGTYSAAGVPINDAGSMMPHVASPITVGANGLVNWGVGSTELSRADTSSFALLLSHGNGVSSFKAEQKHPTSNDRNYAVTLSSDTPGITDAFVSDERQPTPVTYGCVGAKQPLARGANPWRTASQFARAEGILMACSDSRTGNTDWVKVTFTARRASIGRCMLRASAGRRIEVLAVKDGETPTLSYQVVTKKGWQLLVLIRADGMLASITITDPQWRTLTCQQAP